MGRVTLYIVREQIPLQQEQQARVHVLCWRHIIRTVVDAMDKHAPLLAIYYDMCSCSKLMDFTVL